MLTVLFLPAVFPAFLSFFPFIHLLNFSFLTIPIGFVEINKRVHIFHPY